MGELECLVSKENLNIMGITETWWNERTSGIQSSLDTNFTGRTGKGVLGAVFLCTLKRALCQVD